MPPVEGGDGAAVPDIGQVVEGIVYRYRAGVRVAGSARAVRAVADGVEAASPLVAPTGPGIGCWPSDAGRGRRGWPGRTGRVSVGLHRWCGRTSTPPTAARDVSPPSSYTGGGSNDKNSRGRRDEPGDHGIGRSRGGLSTKATCWSTAPAGRWSSSSHPGQAGDAPALLPMLAQLRVARRGPGRPRTRPACCCARTRPTRPAGTAQHLRRPRDQDASSPNRPTRPPTAAAAAPAGGRPVGYDPVEYRGRNVIERGING